jgi:quercetin dioxygenase-like cupin family protein
LRILRRAEQPGRRIEEFASRDASVSFLGRGPASVVRIELEPGGVVGMHPATQPQLFVLVAGEGTVRAGDREPERVAAGDAVFWSAGEEHETRSETGLVAIVVEAPGLEPPR